MLLVLQQMFNISTSTQYTSWHDHQISMQFKNFLILDKI